MKIFSTELLSVTHECCLRHLQHSMSVFVLSLTFSSFFFLFLRTFYKVIKVKATIYTFFRLKIRVFG